MLIFRDKNAKSKDISNCHIGLQLPQSIERCHGLYLEIVVAPTEQSSSSITTTLSAQCTFETLVIESKRFQYRARSIRYFKSNFFKATIKGKICQPFFYHLPI